MVEENVQQLFLRIGYEAQLLRSEKAKPKKVQCFISPRVSYRAYMFSNQLFVSTAFPSSRLCSLQTHHFTRIHMQSLSCNKGRQYYNMLMSSCPKGLLH